jgi:hypothetical protein
MREQMQLDKKTQVSTSLGVIVTVIVTIASATYFVTNAINENTQKVADLGAQMRLMQGSMVTRSQWQEWSDRLRDENNPWRQHGVFVPSLPNPNAPVGLKAIKEADLNE